jgi:hypothetical protein
MIRAAAVRGRRATAMLGGAPFLAAVGLAAACSSTGAATSAPPAGAAVASLRAIVQPHAQITGASVVGVIGSYGSGCTLDGESWALATAGNAAAMAAITSDSAPQVVAHQSACRLTIDRIYTTATTTYAAGYTSTSQPTPLYVAGTGAATAGSYLPRAVSFDDPSADAGSAVAFYANAQSTSVDSSEDFSITLVVGDSPSTGAPTVTAVAQTVSGTVASVAGVPAPDYATDLSNLTLLDNDAGVAVTVLGTVNLDFDTQAGDAYQTFHGQNLSTRSFQQIDALFRADSEDESAIPEDGGTVAIPATSLVKDSDALPVTSTIVVQYVDAASDVTTYQVIAITFNRS